MTIHRDLPIVVLSQGVVAEAGSHDELVARGGVYHKLISSQVAMTVIVTPRLDPV